MNRFTTILRVALAGAALLGVGTQVQAQVPEHQVLSPQVNADGTVTFMCKAPSASSVQVTGEAFPGGRDMTKGEDGVWTFTSEPLESEMYYYKFKIDGASVLDPCACSVILDEKTLLGYFIVPGGTGDLYMPQNVPHGTVHKVWYDCPSLGKAKARRMSIYTPPGYESSKVKFPVLYLLHGSGGNEDAWLSFGRTAQIMDNLIDQGKVTPMIVVMPSGATDNMSIPGEASDEGFYRPKSASSYDTTFEVQFADVLKYVDSNFRTIKKPSGRAITGLSMGGEQSFQTSLNYPKTFDYVGIFSGCVRVRKLSGNELNPEIYKDTEAKIDRLFANGPKLYYIAIGEKDFLYDMNVWLRGYLDSKGYKYVYNESSGGHSWRNWRLYLTDFAQMLFK